LPFIEPLHDPLAQFTVLLAAALLVQLAFERLPLPGIVGLLLAGFVLGPGGAGVVPREPVADLLGHVGLIFLMFMAGVEVDLATVRRHRGETLHFGLLAFGLSLAPAFAAGLLLGFGVLGAVLLGALVSSHTLVAYPIVERHRLQHRRGVTTAVGGTLVTDTLALIVLAVVLRGAAGDEGPARALLPLLLLAALAAAALRSVPPLSRFLFHRAWLTRAEKALYVLVVLLLLAAAAELAGTKDILGAFLAGICLNRPLREEKRLLEHVEFVGRLLFIPFFFLATGMLLEVELLAGSGRLWAVAGVLVALVVLGKSAAIALAARRYGYPAASRRLMLGLTIPQAAATLAVATAGHDAGVFGVEVVDAVIVAIFVTCVAGALLTGHAARQLTAVEPPPGAEPGGEAASAGGAGPEPGADAPARRRQ
jgi:Kef-type K+ transport system membrane component KefB